VNYLLTNNVQQLSKSLIVMAEGNSGSYAQPTLGPKAIALESPVSPSDRGCKPRTRQLHRATSPPNPSLRYTARYFIDISFAACQVDRVHRISGKKCSCGFYAYGTRN
jgi:hypothetical protein